MTAAHPTGSTPERSDNLHQLYTSCLSHQGAHQFVFQQEVMSEDEMEVGTQGRLMVQRGPVCMPSAGTGSPVPRDDAP